MALSPNDIKDDYPLPAYNYMVSMATSIPLFTPFSSLSLKSDWVAFSEVHGLQVEYETISYRHGLSWLEGPTHLRGRKKAANITLKRGIVKDRNKLVDWIESSEITLLKKDILIVLCNENANPVVSWLVRNAFPIKLEAPQFAAHSNDIAIETLTVMADQINVEYH